MHRTPLHYSSPLYKTWPYPATLPSTAHCSTYFNDIYCMYSTVLTSCNALHPTALLLSPLQHVTIPCHTRLYCSLLYLLQWYLLYVHHCTDQLLFDAPHCTTPLLSTTPDHTLPHSTLLLSALLTPIHFKSFRFIEKAFAKYVNHSSLAHPLLCISENEPTKIMFPVVRSVKWNKFNSKFNLVGKYCKLQLFPFMSPKGEPVEVTVEIKVVSFGELNEANMVWRISAVLCKTVFSHCLRLSTTSRFGYQTKYRVCPGTNFYTWAERTIVRIKCLAQNTTQCLPPSPPPTPPDSNLVPLIWRGAH